MILEQTIKVKINSLNQKHYDEFYDLPKKWSKSNRRFVVTSNTIIEVNVKHLMSGCNSLIKYKCDECRNIFETGYSNYNRKAKPEGKDLCVKCYRKLYPFGKHIHNWGFGKNAPNWNPNMTDEDRTYRDTPEYKNFIAKCMKRDKYICQLSGQVGGKLVVHHLKSYARFPKYRINVDNGITITEELHNEFHGMYGKMNFTEKDFIKFKMEKIDGE